MSAVNHTIRPSFNIQIAVIEGTPVIAFCGKTFVPTVTVGTSGRATVPGAPNCPDCETAIDMSERFTQLRDEKNRITREMRALQREHKKLIHTSRERHAEPVTA